MAKLEVKVLDLTTPDTLNEILDTAGNSVGYVNSESVVEPGFYWYLPEEDPIGDAGWTLEGPFDSFEAAKSDIRKRWGVSA